MSKRNLTLLTDLYELTMMQGYFYAKDANETVIFDAFYRTNPDGNGFAIAAGLEQVIEYIEDLHFDPEDIDYLPVSYTHLAGGGHRLPDPAVILLVSPAPQLLHLRSAQGVHIQGLLRDLLRPVHLPVDIRCV